MMNLLDKLLQDNNNMTGLAADVPGATMAQSLTPYAMDRTMDGLTSQLGRNATGAIGNALAGYMAGMPADMIGPGLMSSMMNPGAMTGLVSAPAKAMLGIAPEGMLGKVASYGLNGLAGLLGGPVAGLATGVLGDFAIDLGLDAIDARKDEAKRDDMESELGWGYGHMAYADEKDIRSKQPTVQSPIAGLAAKQAMVNAIQGVYDKYGYANQYDRAMASTMSGGRGNAYGGRGDFAGIDLSGGYGNTTYGVGPFRDLDFSVAANAFGLGGLGGYGGSGRADNGGFGENDGNSDTAGNAGYGR